MNFLLGFSDDDICPPVMTKQPSFPDTEQRKKSLSVSVSAVGEGILSYHWMKDGIAFFDENLSNCRGADTHTLCITSFTDEHEGEYKCVVSNAGGSVESKTIDLYLFGKILVRHAHSV